MAKLNYIEYLVFKFNSKSYEDFCMDVSNSVLSIINKEYYPNNKIIEVDYLFDFMRRIYLVLEDNNKKIKHVTIRTWNIIPKGKGFETDTSIHIYDENEYED